MSEPKANKDEPGDDDGLKEAEQIEVFGTPLTVSWVGIDPRNWRDMLDPEADFDPHDDEDHAWPLFMKGILGAESSLVAAEQSAEAVKDIAAANGQRAYEIKAADAQKLLADAKARTQAV